MVSSAGLCICLVLRHDMLTKCCSCAGMTQAVVALALMGNALLRRKPKQTSAQDDRLRQCNEEGKVGVCSKRHYPINPFAYCLQLLLLYAL